MKPAVALALTLAAVAMIAAVALAVAAWTMLAAGGAAAPAATTPTAPPAGTLVAVCHQLAAEPLPATWGAVIVDPNGPARLMCTWVNAITAAQHGA